jgi:deoxyribodipyrimidine photo-lyase
VAQTILIWYRNDLRVHDHEPLTRALRAGAQVIPLYCVDPRHFGETSFGFPKTGAYRATFLLESLADLRSSLRSLGSDLVIRRGHPEAIIPALAKELGCQAVYFHQEVTFEERLVEAAVSEALDSNGIAATSFWGATLYHPDDLPFEISQLPEVFTQFRKAVEKQSSVNPAFPAPNHLRSLPALDVGEIPTFEALDIPTLDSLGTQAPEPDDRAVLRFIGGESAGKDRLKTYIWDNDCLRRYKHTRNGMLGADYSSKFSPWLALGCLSPRYIYEEVKRYEDERVANQSTYWLVFELLWRDYFRFICAKHGDRVFYPSGLLGLPIAWTQDWDRFEQWRLGETGFPLVDANMRELLLTGFMSNRGRQNVASFLTKNLGIDWRMGAEWFESQLIDYDVCSNYGNWNYTAGVGNDSRGFRYFNIPKQAKDYDSKGEYVKHWLPELQHVPANKVHEPWKLSADEQKRCKVTIGVDYPNPVVDLWKSVKHNESVYNTALNQLI